MVCLSGIFKDLIYRRRLKKIINEEMIADKLKEDLSLPIRRKLLSIQKHYATPSIIFHNKRQSFIRHQENFEDSNENPLITSQSMETPMFKESRFKNMKRHTNLTKQNPNQIKLLVLPPNWHNFQYDKDEQLVGWPDNVKIVKNTLD